ncbi:hypothetical protein NEOLEDRAFT_1151906 [Neolentinus lepideus HHB14362 ss-1]|uniref:Uncharacterized protein n=1 Tax=Neolentinus lepideus HHB14362 ss-1 TaxID=1314782 RepID=A0A165NDV9_9AGAM|nr:hypothetical protein NEOLEDRAFT_1151906 [Neolentinus lepideus HHB14362 ss-1]
MYRFWLYIEAFRPNYHLFDPDIENYMELKEAFFQQLPSSAELYELARIVQFLTEIVQWVSIAIAEVFEVAGDGMPSETGFALFSAPSVILQMFKDQSGAPLLALADPWDGSIGEEFDFIKDALSVAFKTRKLSEPVWDSHEMKKVILDEYEQYDRPLHADWGLLKGHLPPHVLATSMIGHLPRNPYETNSLYEYLYQLTLFFAPIMSWVFDKKDDSDQYRDLSPDDWIFISCLLTFTQSRLHLWWLDRKRTEGMHIPLDDCWYGYNCRTQIHRYAHAAKLNHLCAPTRGDPAY